MNDYIGYVATLPNNKEVLFLDRNESIGIFQRLYPGEHWEPINPRVLDHTRLPSGTSIEPIPIA